MAYILSTDLPHPHSLAYQQKYREQWNLYRQYLQRIQRQLRPATRAFALAEWHYNPDDHRCPHDAWFESLTLSHAGNLADKEVKPLKLVVRLLGAYHDGHIELRYTNVFSYAFDFPPATPQPPAVVQEHGDWMIDEIRYSERGKIIHEIEWASGARWII